jgi:hypothetical protein
VTIAQKLVITFLRRSAHTAPGERQNDAGTPARSATAGATRASCSPSAGSESPLRAGTFGDEEQEEARVASTLNGTTAR